MAKKGNAFFDDKGEFFKTPEEATQSDLSALLGRIGEGDSLAPGIAYMLLERRADIEKIFAEHDVMKAKELESHSDEELSGGNVTKLPHAKLPKSG